MAILYFLSTTDLCSLVAARQRKSTKRGVGVATPGMEGKGTGEERRVEVKKLSAMAEEQSLYHPMFSFMASMEAV